MSVIDGGLLVLGLLIVAYLGYALVRPEKFR